VQDRAGRSLLHGGSSQSAGPLPRWREDTGRPSERSRRIDREWQNCFLNFFASNAESHFIYPCVVAAVGFDPSTGVVAKATFTAIAPFNRRGFADRKTEFAPIRVVNFLSMCDSSLT